MPVFLFGLKPNSLSYVHQFLGRSMKGMDPHSKPSDWWYLPPGLAGGLFVLATLFFHPIVPLVFGLLGVLVGFVVTTILFLIFGAMKNANEWARILMAWVSVVAMYVLSELFWCELIGC